MNIHRNARTTPYIRAEVVRRVMTSHETPSTVATATAFGLSYRTVAKWPVSYRAECQAGLLDRSSHPRRMPRATAADIVDQVIAARCERLCGKQIAAMLQLSPVTIIRADMRVDAADLHVAVGRRSA